MVNGYVNVPSSISRYITLAFDNAVDNSGSVLVDKENPDFNEYIEFLNACGHKIPFARITLDADIIATGRYYSNSDTTNVTFMLGDLELRIDLTMGDMRITVTILA